MMLRRVLLLLLVLLSAPVLARPGLPVDVVESPAASAHELRALPDDLLHFADEGARNRSLPREGTTLVPLREDLHQRGQSSIAPIAVVFAVVAVQLPVPAPFPPVVDATALRRGTFPHPIVRGPPPPFTHV